MNQPDLFPSLGFSIAPGKRAFQPKATPSGCKRMLARCTKKDCKFCKAFDLPTEARKSAIGGPSYQAISREALATAKAMTKCPTHPNASIRFEEIAGNFSESRLCDPRCTNAIGPNCDCQCGGANHGCGWL